MRPPVPFKWRGNHHSYTGLWFVAFGVFNWFMSWDNLDSLIPLWQVVIGVGVFMLVDDVVEHKVTADTPLRLLWEKVIRPWLR
jgi:hypothetical protein